MAIPTAKMIEGYLESFAENLDKPIDVKKFKKQNVNRGNGTELESIQVEYTFDHGNGHRAHVAHFKSGHVVIMESGEPGKLGRHIETPAEISSIYS